MYDYIEKSLLKPKVDNLALIAIAGLGRDYNGIVILISLLSTVKTEEGESSMKKVKKLIAFIVTPVTMFALTTVAFAVVHSMLFGPRVPVYDFTVHNEN